MELTIKLENDDIASERLAISVIAILERIQLLSMATVNPDGSPHINTCFFAYDSDLRIFVLTPPSTSHARNISHHPKASIAVFDSHQISGTELQGLQIIADGSEANDQLLVHGLQVYSSRFPSLREAAPDVKSLLANFESRLFVFSVSQIKIFDEITFGKETWITTSVTRG